MKFSAIFMCTVCSLLEVRADPNEVKGSGSTEKTIVAERGYKEDNTNRRDALANNYTTEGRERMPGAPRFEYIPGGRQYVEAPAQDNAFYSARQSNTVEPVRQEVPSYIESLAA